MDPIKIDDPLTNELKALIGDILKDMNELLTMHDFRIVPGETHTNVIFDVVVPFQVKETNQELLDELIHRVREKKGKTYYLVVTFDRAYTSNI